MPKKGIAPLEKTANSYRQLLPIKNADNFKTPIIRKHGSLAGFTLLELALIIGILVIIFSMGLPMAFEFYQNYQLQTEEGKFISFLETARNSSMTNLNQFPHGVYRDNDNYIVFEGNSFAARNQSQDQSFPRAKTVSVSGPNEIIFNSLSGQTASSTFVFSNGIKSFNVYVNQEGQINW